MPPRSKKNSRKPPVLDAEVSDPPPEEAESTPSAELRAEEETSLLTAVEEEHGEPKDAAAAAEEEIAVEKAGEEELAGNIGQEAVENGGSAQEAPDEDREVEEKMDVDKEGDKELAEDETRESEIKNVNRNAVDKAGDFEGAAGVTDDNDESDDKADDEENEDEADLKENENDANLEENEEEAEDEDDPALYMQAPLTLSNKEKHFEIFVGGLDKGAVEDDLIKVFGAFGEIQSVRIVKHPVTQKSKGFAFVHYASIEHAKKALTELKEGTEVKGKQIQISACDDNDTLYLGNICKTWTKDNVIETLKGYGIEQIEDILLPDDSKNEGRNRGFGFIEFASHSDAMSAFQRLRKPDAVFGRDISAKVSFAQTSLHPSEESLLQVKTVYLEGIPKSWDDGKVEELCKQHGEIEKIQLSRNFTFSKRKDFGFVEFSSRDAALACVEAIKNAQLGEGDASVKANIAKPAYKGRLARQSARGGYKIKKDGDAAEAIGQSKKKKKAKSKVVHVKEETQPKVKYSIGSKPPNSQGKGSNGKKGKVLQSSKGNKRGRQGMDTGNSEKPSKRVRNNQKHGNMRGRPSTGFENKRSSYTHQTTYAPSYATPAASYTAHAYAGTSGTHYHRSDLEPHAGFVPAAQHVRNPYEYDLRRAGTYDSQVRGSSGYAGASLNRTPYPGYSSYPGYEAGYTYRSNGAYGYRGPYY